MADTFDPFDCTCVHATQIKSLHERCRVKARAAKGRSKERRAGQKPRPIRRTKAQKGCYEVPIALPASSILDHLDRDVPARI